jgi:FkbM family methyltransferase
MIDLRQSSRKLVRETFRRIGLRVSRLAADQIRGAEPLLDLKFLLGCDPDLVIFDVGANDGETAASILESFPRARLTAFEPFRECYAKLATRLGGDGRVRIENLAMGDKAGAAQLNLYSGDRMNSLLDLNTDPTSFMSGFKKTGSESVRIATLDDYCAQHGTERIDLLKVDTLGFDLNVLRGAARLFTEQRIGAVLLEVNFVSMYAHQASFTDLHGFVIGQGFRLVDFYNHVWKNGHIAWCDACYVGPRMIAAHSPK